MHRRRTIDASSESEMCIVGERKTLARRGMNERQIPGMEHQSADRRMPVEFISHNRSGKSVGMRTMHTQLVCSACVGKESYERLAIQDLLYVIFRYRGFAVLAVHDLSRSVGLTRQQRQTDNAVARSGRHTVEYGRIALYHFPAGKLLMKTAQG